MITIHIAFCSILILYKNKYHTHQYQKIKNILYRSYTVSTWPATGPSHAEGKKQGTIIFGSDAQSPSCTARTEYLESPGKSSWIEPIPWSNQPPSWGLMSSTCIQICIYIYIFFLKHTILLKWSKDATLQQSSENWLSKSFCKKTTLL